MNWPFGDLKPFGYDLIMADPPWSFKTFSQKGWKKAAQNHYQCATLEDIKALPVADLAADDCVLWLWATNPMIPQALETMSAWGFTFKTAGNWHKLSKTGQKDHFGTGYLLRSSNEPYLIGTRGKPKTSRSVRGGFRAPVREHSRKPEECFEMAEKLITNARRLELFSRQSRPGWDNWGNESTKFDEEAA